MNDSPNTKQAVERFVINHFRLPESKRKGAIFYLRLLLEDKRVSPQEHQELTKWANFTFTTERTRG